MNNFSELRGKRAVPTYRVPGPGVTRTGSLHLECDSPIKEVARVDLISCLGRKTDWLLARASKLGQGSTEKPALHTA